MKTIALIPARGGSKRLPGKNLKLLDGRPLIAHSIAWALAHPEIIDAVFVSTDDAQIKQTALAYGAQVIDRPEHLSSDEQPTVTALQHALSVLPDSVSEVVLLQPTNPLRPQDLLSAAFALYRNHAADSLMTVSSNHQKFGKIIDRKFVPYNYQIGQRSQDLEPLYFENGLLYISSASLIKQGIVMSENGFPMIVDHPFAQVDIDTQEDFDYAQYLMQKHRT